MIISKNLKLNWLIYSIGGLLLIGAGLSLFGEALTIKINPLDTRSWFWWGTASLVVFNSGISLFGQGVIYRVRMDKKSE
jgi:hypothetical protein